MLELRNLSKRFEDKQIFSNYDLVIPEGKLLPSLVNLAVVRQLFTDVGWFRDY